MKANERKSFIGSYVLGMGFTFDDTDNKGVATPLTEMKRLIAKDSRNQERVFPYIGGEEVNDSPTHAHHRYVINFEDFPLRREDLGASWKDADNDLRKEWLRDGIVPLDYPEPVAAEWPDLLDLVEENVRPDRLTDNRDNYRRYWWQFAERRPGLVRALKGLGRTLVTAQTSNTLAFCYLPAQTVFSHKLVVFADPTSQLFCVLQSRPHQEWIRLQGSTMKDDQVYTPEDCFETFPFPPDFGANVAIERAGFAYYDFRAQLMQRENKGLTAIYNWFHDPECECPDIPKLRELHDATDRAVLDAYGWTDIQQRCEFVPEYGDEEEDDENGRPRRKKYRYRWPDDTRDEVLARLLELNRQRALEEGQLPTESLVFAGAANPAPKKAGSRKKGGKRSSNLNLSLLSQEKEEA